MDELRLIRSIKLIRDIKSIQPTQSKQKTQTTQKGQMWTADFLSISFILIIILITFLYTWNTISIHWNNTESYNRIYATTLFAIESLVTYPGNPPSWENLNIINETTFSNFGLVNQRGVINNRKLDRLLNVSLDNYTFFRQRFGAPTYNVFIILTDTTRTKTYYEIGNESVLNETVTFERLVVYNNSPAIISLAMWR